MENTSDAVKPVEIDRGKRGDSLAMMNCAGEHADDARMPTRRLRLCAVGLGVNIGSNS